MKFFFSWQSDRPGKTGHYFIRDALEVALREASQDAGFSEADRPELDHDTKDVSGSPDLAETILEKIRESDVFVADVTPVGVTSAGKPILNPNVAIELGYSLKALGSRRLLMIMNGAHGTRDSLPFDLRHKRGPTFYVLRDDASVTDIKAAQKSLVTELKIAIQGFIKAGPAIAPEAPAPFVEAPPTAQRAMYFQPGEVLAETRPHFGERREKFAYDAGALLYLRLIPSRRMPELGRAEAEELLHEDPILPPLDTGSGHSIALNRYGAIAWSGVHSAGRLRSTTQLFTTREIWGIDFNCLRASARDQDHEEFGVIPSDIYEAVLRGGLHRYCGFALQRLQIVPPLIVEAGASGVSGYRMAMPSGYQRYSGRVDDDEIWWRGQLPDYDKHSIDKAALHIFERFFDACGLRRPDGFNRFSVSPVRE